MIVSSPKNFLVRVSAALVLLVSLSAAGSPEEKQISVYSTVANYSLPVLQQNGHDYVGFFEVIDPLGKVNLKIDGNHWNIRYNDVECDFKKGSETARLQGQNVHLGSNFVLQNNHGFVPVNSLSALLPKLLGGPVTVNEAARRVFIGNVGIHFTAQIRNTALVMDFTSGVNPSISTEPGKLKLIFAHEPVEAPSTPTLTFSSQQIASATFSENNGAVEIAIAGSVPLFASFSNNGKTITIQAAPQQQVSNKRTATQSPASNNAQVLPFAPQSAPRYFAIIDAAHGGTETGATLGNQLFEKDVTLAIARHLRDELMVRNVSVMLVRDGDDLLTTDQRASAANQQHPAIYICIHASTEGRGVRVYTALMASGGTNQGPFLDWQTAQSPFLSSSQQAAATIAAELQKSHVSARQLTAALRPLNNILAAAVGVEVAPPTSSPDGLASPAYQQFIAGAIANGITDLRYQPGAAQ
ncbi:MAG TPA: N-acetylmuramoyl-L-alanine amidase [Terriglobales bacterium]